MSLETVRTLLPFAARDVLALIGAREEFESTLDAFARRRAGFYANPRAARTDALYWPALAAAIAPVGPPIWMPMSGLIEHGITLEGGAKGLRGLFTKEPSEKERRKVLKTATLAARVMEIVVSGSGTALSDDEQRLIAMAMASFGLTADELDKTRPPGPVGFDSLEIFGELDTPTRRELVRGAWQLAMAGKVDPTRDMNVRGIAQRMEMSGEADQLRADVASQQTRHGEMATVAVEIVRGAARLLPFDVIKPWIEHMVTCAAPASRHEELLARALGNDPPAFELLPKLDAARRRQAVALALGTLLGHDPGMSQALYLRVELRTSAVAAGVGGEIGEAFTIVDRYLFDRVRDAVAAAHEATKAAALPAGAPSATATAGTASSASTPSAPSASAPVGEADGEKKG